MIERFSGGELTRIIKLITEIPCFLANPNEEVKDEEYSVLNISNATTYETYTEVEGVLSFIFFKRDLISTLTNFHSEHFSMAFKREYLNRSSFMQDSSNRNILDFNFYCCIDKDTTLEELITEVQFVLKKRSL